MHIITGMLLSFLFTQKKRSNKPPLLQLRWPIITKHLLPGRVRFQIPLLVSQEKTVKDLTQQLEKIEGVQQIDCSIITGSVLILFDEGKLQAELLFAALIRLLNLEQELEKLPAPIIRKEIKRIGQGLNQAIYSKSNGLLDLKTLVPLSFGLFGIYRLIAERPISLPTSITMIWWAYNSLINNDKQGNIF